jgi:hypothetical protein
LVKDSDLLRTTFMVYAMDTLGYAKRLRDAGVSQQQAEAHAEAARDFIMAELVTKTDLQAAEARLEGRIVALEGKIDTQTLRLTVRLGALLAAGIALLTTILRLT